MKIITQANMTRNPEVIPTQNQNLMIKFGIADNRYVGKNPDGSAKMKPVFVECIAFGGVAQHILNNGVKGSPIFVEAELDYNTFTYENGQKSSQLSFVVQSARVTAKLVSNQAPQQNQNTYQNPQAQAQPQAQAA